MKISLLLIGIAVLTSTGLSQTNQGKPAPATSAPPAAAAKTGAPVAGKPSQGAAAPKPKPEFPTPPLHVIYRPSFLTQDMAHYFGMAFRLKQPVTGQHFLVTSHTAFSKNAGLDVQMTSDDVARVIVAAVGVSCNDRFKLLFAQPYVGPKDAQIWDEKKGSDKDMAFFVIPGQSTEPALVLDPAPPMVGDRVWIYVKYPGSPKVGVEGATLLFVSENELRYRLDNQNVDLQNTTGAPVLSIDSEVVGMHLGTFRAQSGKVLGFGCPGPAIRRAIEPLKRGKVLQ